MIKQFIPSPTAPKISRSDVQELFRKGELVQAQKLCKLQGQVLANFLNDIDAGTRKLAISHRTGIALSFIFKNKQLYQAKPIELIRSCFNQRDYHSFLKNCVRFTIKTDLASEIEVALAKVRQEEAEAWRKKLSKFE